MSSERPNKVIQRPYSPPNPVYEVSFHPLSHNVLFLVIKKKIKTLISKISPDVLFLIMAHKIETIISEMSHHVLFSLRMVELETIVSKISHKVRFLLINLKGETVVSKKFQNVPQVSLGTYFQSFIKLCFVLSRQ